MAIFSAQSFTRPLVIMNRPSGSSPALTRYSPILKFLTMIFDASGRRRKVSMFEKMSMLLRKPILDSYSFYIPAFTIIELMTLSISSTIKSSCAIHVDLCLLSSITSSFVKVSLGS